MKQKRNVTISFRKKSVAKKSYQKKVDFLRKFLKKKEDEKRNS